MTKKGIANTEIKPSVSLELHVYTTFFFLPKKNKKEVLKTSYLHRSFYENENN